MFYHRAKQVKFTRIVFSRSYFVLSAVRRSPGGGHVDRRNEIVPRARVGQHTRVLVVVAAARPSARVHQLVHGTTAAVAGGRRLGAGKLVTSGVNTIQRKVLDYEGQVRFTAVGFYNQ